MPNSVQISPLPNKTSPLQSIDYLLVGHITQDLVDSGTRLGGTVTYSGLTARALGMSVGIVTSCAKTVDLSILDGIQVVTIPAQKCTTFRNIPGKLGREQYLYEKATILDQSMIPQAWKNAQIIHLGPVANEFDPELINSFDSKAVFLTPQGWLRSVDAQKQVHPLRWHLSPAITARAAAVVLSSDDIQGDEEQVRAIVSSCPIVVVTENKYGARVFWNGEECRINTPQVALLEDTGAGDIFAAAFFFALSTTENPWKAARFAVKLSAASVTRKYLESVPTYDEITAALKELEG